MSQETMHLSNLFRLGKKNRKYLLNGDFRSIKKLELYLNDDQLDILNFDRDSFLPRMTLHLSESNDKPNFEQEVNIFSLKNK